MHNNKNILESEISRMKNLMSIETNEQLNFYGPILGTQYIKIGKKVSDWVGTWNKKDWLTFIELTSGILGSIPSPASPILLSISLGAGVANAKIYWDEGDKYGAGLFLVFSLLGAGVLARSLRNSKIFMRLGKKGSMDLIQKVNSGLATTTEKKMAKQLVEEVSPSIKELGSEVVKETTRRILSELSKKSFMFILKLCIGMTKLGVFGIKEGIVISGTFLAYDKMYKAINYRNEKNLSIREKNELVKIYSIISNNKEEVKEMMINEIKSAESKIIENNKAFISIDTAYKINF